MKVFYTNTFSKGLESLPASARKLFKKQEDIFCINWKDSRLHIKKLKYKGEVFSFRITRKYRVLFIFFDSESAVFVSVGHRKDIYL